MNQKKPVLGRGLDALLGQMSASRTAAPAASPGAAAAPAGLPGDELARLPLGQLQRGRYQPRVDMRQETLEDLANSIRAQGVVQPIVVRPLEMPGAAPGEAPTRYEIIAGERRWRAAQLAGLESIPAVIRRVPDESAIAMALIENIQRENLNPLEEARALDRLIREFEVTHQQAADAVGRSRAAVSNLLRLLELPPEVAELVDRRELEMGHARALLGLPQKRQQIEVGLLVSKKSLSVRETEALVRRMNNKAQGQGNGHGATGSSSGGGSTGAGTSAGGAGGKDPNILELETRLADTLGARVEIEHAGKGGKGRLVIVYNSLDELDGILAHIH
ncbi:MAG: ParB/RepB/Spo0J family partition protein [Hyphomicrobiales bacterium]|nr:ParB/RepB/Spo0J family partition protein [Hyphomicrobiales bacterium]